ncbi:MAG: ROK family protein [Spirochaetota bacterium]
MKKTIGQPELLKEINRTRVFNILSSERTVSRAQLAKKTGLSRATISILVEKLLQIGLVEEVGYGNSSGGRPPVLLKYNPNAAFAIGAYMYDYEWSLVITNLDAEIMHQETIHIPSNDYQVALATLKNGVEHITRNLPPDRLLPAIGIGTPGLVDSKTGIIKSAVDLGWFEVPIKDLVKKALGLEAFVVNRSKIGALAEFWHGAGEGIRELIYISIGTGVAAGIIHDGKLYFGANSSTGELGHVTILPEGPACPCGNRGCLQQLISEKALEIRARELLREDRSSSLHTKAGNHPEMLNARDILEAADQGDPLAGQIVDEASEYLGIAVGNLINLFNPELVVLGGPVGCLSKLLTEKLQQKARKRAMTYPLSVVTIRRSSLGLDAGAIGASVLVLQRAKELLFRKSPAYLEPSDKRK